MQKIEQLHGKTCEAVDVLGYDPHVSQVSLQSTTRSTGRMNGIQSPEKLTLRTCPEHRMRVLLLSNHKVGQMEFIVAYWVTVLGQESLRN